MRHEGSNLGSLSNKEKRVSTNTAESRSSYPTDRPRMPNTAAQENRSNRVGRWLPGRSDARLSAAVANQRVLDAVAKSPTPVLWFVIAAEPVTSVDVRRPMPFLNSMRPFVLPVMKRFGLLHAWERKRSLRQLAKRRVPTALAIPLITTRSIL